MARRFLFGLVVFAATPLHAQQNPFKPPRPAVRTGSVEYQLAGDMTGTATFAFDGDRAVRRSVSSLKIMGRSEEIASWQLFTADSVWIADLRENRGTVSPNLLPHLARAYDDLDGAGKRRLHQNLEGMAGLLGQAFGFSNLGTGQRVGKKTYAGQECDERRLGGFTVCQMERAPVVLHTSGNLVCMSFSETATAVQLSPPPAEAFAKPAGITWTADAHLQKPDSVARGFVLYLSSQELADSLARARALLDSAQQAQADPAREPSEDERAAMREACEFVKNFNAGQLMASAADAVWKGLVASVRQAALDALRREAVRGLGGLIRRPP